MKSILAVLNPANTDYLYFVADRQGHNHYSRRMTSTSPSSSRSAEARRANKAGIYDRYKRYK